MNSETIAHRLILPRDANHHGTLYAGTLLSLALEAAYAAAFAAMDSSANLVLKRVLDLRCFEPVAIGRVIEIRGRELLRARAMVVIGLHGSPLPGRSKPWMDGLMQFAQVDEHGRPAALAGDPDELPEADSLPWSELTNRGRRLLAVRH